MLTIPVNSFVHVKFDGVIVPDIYPWAGQPNLSGKLSRSRLDATNKRAYFAGIFTSTRKMNLDEDLDYLIIVSGPEPQRTKLEEIILKQVQKLPGRRWCSWEALRRRGTRSWMSIPQFTLTYPRRIKWS